MKRLPMILGLLIFVSTCSWAWAKGGVAAHGFHAATVAHRPRVTTASRAPRAREKERMRAQSIEGYRAAREQQQFLENYSVLMNAMHGGLDVSNGSSHRGGHTSNGGDGSSSGAASDAQQIYATDDDSTASP